MISRTPVMPLLSCVARAGFTCLNLHWPRGPANQIVRVSCSTLRVNWIPIAHTIRIDCVIPT